MRTTTLGPESTSVSALGLATGVMRSDRDIWEPGNESELVAAIHFALDSGLNLIDTAPSHGRGLAEELVGKALMGRREGAVLATKCGLLLDEHGETGRRRSLRPDSIRDECEASLRRLRVETIDVYQCHWPDPETPIADTAAALDQLVSQGKIRSYGLANFGLSRLADARAAGRFRTLQIPFSLLQRDAQDDLLPYCKKNGFGVLACDPLAGGRLADDAPPQTTAGEAGAPLRSTRDRLAALAARRQCTIRQLAVAWTLAQPEVTATLVPVRRTSDVRQALAAERLRLKPADLAELEAATADGP